MKRMLHVVAVALVFAFTLGACGNNPAPDGQKKEGFYEDNFEPGDSYPYTKPK